MANIQVEITDASEFHCFRLVLNPRGHAPDCAFILEREALLACGTKVACSCGAEGSGTRLEIMFHARALVDLIHEASTALCEWQRQTTTQLICAKTGFTEDEARAAGLIA